MMGIYDIYDLCIDVILFSNFTIIMQFPLFKIVVYILVYATSAHAHIFAKIGKMNRKIDNFTALLSNVISFTYQK